jgi:hypothetical protein
MNLFATIVVGILIGFGVLLLIDLVFLLLFELAIRRQARP